MLAAEHIFRQFGGVRALDGVDFEVVSGEVHALVGENGAGKSTLAKIIAGSVRPDAGVVRMNGAAVPAASPIEAQRHGIGIIYQELDLFPNLTVGENIVIGNLHYAERGAVNFRRIESFCRPWLDLAGLAIPSRTLLGSLPIARRQLVAIARALSMEARLILMDEPTSSLFGDSAERLFHLIGDLKRRGVAIVYVSHKMEEIFRLADRITVLRDGRKVETRRATGTSPAEIIRMMVGRDLEAFEAVPRTGGDVLLRVSNLSTAKLREVSFELRAGEVLGVAGLVGSGRSELGETLFGRATVTAGSIDLRGHRIGLVPEDRKEQGLMMEMSITENSTFRVLRRLRSFGLLSVAKERRAVEPLAARLSLKCSSFGQAVRSLSGGNQQKVLLARWLLDDPRILFLDDPARGIDVGAKQDIYRMIDELAAAGKGVILVSSELPELMRCSDRIIVLREGRIAGSFERADATQESIMAAAT